MKKQGLKNELIAKELATMISRDVSMENGLITITNIKIPSHNKILIQISVLPDNKFGTALKKVRKMSSQFSHELKKKMNFRSVPKLFWEIDSTEKYADQIQKIINEETR